MPHLRNSFLIVLAALLSMDQPGLCGGQDRYDHGDPTTYEQLVLELANRARADPSAEAARYGLPDLNENLPAGTLTTAPKQPLAFNPHLIAAARGHSQWMIDADTFSHTGLNGSQPTARMQAAGYPLSGSWGTGENIGGFFSTSLGGRTWILQNHHEGLFLSAVHRENILGPDFNEIGIGELIGAYRLNGTNYSASSLLTQNFAHSWGSPSPDGPFLTGVVYEDRDGDGFYSSGEGIGDVEIRPDSGQWYAVSSSSGGYAIPVGFAAGEINLVLNGVGFSATRVRVALPGGVNVKADFLAGMTSFPDPWADAAAYAGGWFASDWYGWFTQPHAGWIYHLRHGFQHYQADEGGGVLIHDTGLQAWLWTSEAVYPVVYLFGPSAGWYLWIGESLVPAA